MANLTLIVAIYVINNYFGPTVQRASKKVIFNVLESFVTKNFKNKAIILIGYILQVIDNNKSEQIRFLLHFLSSQNDETKTWIIAEYGAQLLILFETSLAFTRIEKENICTTFFSSLSGSLDILAEIDSINSGRQHKSEIIDSSVYKDEYLNESTYEAYLKGINSQRNDYFLKEYYEEHFVKDFTFVLNEHGEDYAIKWFCLMKPRHLNTMETYELLQETKEKIDEQDLRLRATLDLGE